MSTLADLIALYRLETDDRKTPFLWSDPELTEYANDAQNEAARRARLLLDSTTAAICRLAFTAGGSPVLRLDPRVIQVRRMLWTGRSLPLQPRLVAQMDGDFPGWETHTGREPSLYVTDVQTQAIRLYPTPTVSGSVALSVYRLPLDPMTAKDDEPEIPEYAQRGLLQHMLWRGYGKQDADTLDKTKAVTAYKLFVQEYGEAHSARNIAWMTQEMVTMPESLV